MPHLALNLASGAALSVRRFEVREAISTPFTLSVWARVADSGIDLGAIAGAPANFVAQAEGDAGIQGSRTWTGICAFAQQVQAEGTGLSTYFFRIVPTLWLLTLRSGHRIFQFLTIPEIVDKILAEWGIDHTWKIDESLYPPLELKVQWGETDYAFVSRLLEEAGVSFTFSEDGSTLQLADAPQAAEVRPGSPIRWMEQPGRAAMVSEYITHVGLGQEVRPGAFTFRDTDFRRPAYALFGKAKPAAAPEARLEQYVYQPGAFAENIDLGDGAFSTTPVSDDRGAVRHDDEYGGERAQRALDGERAGHRAVSFDANVLDLSPGTVFTILGHPHDELGADDRLLCTEITIEADVHDTFHTSGRAAFAAAPWKPRLATPKPRVRGVQSAIVVGPAGEEIHTDELGRVRVQFPWDREGSSNELSSCWMRVSQGWGGLGYGLLALPRVGHEVLVDFLDGDPDCPVVVGRVFDATQPVPYKLPDHKTISTWKSDSSPGSGGFNEILFEDRKGDELVSTQAEKNQRKLVKNDERLTVGRDRTKHVGVHETDTTGANRTEVTGISRTQVDGGNRILAVGADRARLVGGSRVTLTEGVHMRLTGGDVDAVLRGKRRERVEGEVHQRVVGDRREEIDGKQSLTVGDDRMEKVKGAALFEAGASAHYEAGTDAVLHGVKDATLKGGGGFIRIDSAGVTIVGATVKINAGGSPGSAPSAQPDVPEDPIEADVAMPELPPIPPLPKPPGARSWIELALVSEDDPSKSVPFARYRVETASGKIIDGRLDAAGKALVQGVDEGSCKVTFPDLDKGTWSG
jgi:type VI secretion system secreted protein VgrG